MFHSTNKADRLCLGWWPALVTLALCVSFKAGALDLDSEIRRQDNVANEVKHTLGRDRGSLKIEKREVLPSLDESDMVDDYKVELIPLKRDKST